MELAQYAAIARSYLRELQVNVEDSFEIRIADETNMLQFLSPSSISDVVFILWLDMEMDDDNQSKNSLKASGGIGKKKLQKKFKVGKRHGKRKFRMKRNI